MQKNVDQNIDRALEHLYESKDWISKSDDLEDADVLRENNIVDLLVDNELAIKLNDTIYNLNFVELKIPTCKISPKGLEVIRQGGWLHYLSKENSRLARADRKEIFDYNISKWQSKTFWPVLILGLFGGIYSAFDIYEKHISGNEPQERDIQLNLNKSDGVIDKVINKIDSSHYKSDK